MRFKVGDMVEPRDGSRVASLPIEAAGLPGYVGDAWVDGRGERIHLHYEVIHLYVSDLPADEFVLQPVAAIAT